MSVAMDYPRLKVLEVMIILLGHASCIVVPTTIVFGIEVEALGIAGPAYGGNDRPPVSSVIYILPVDALEEWVVFHTLCPAANVAESLGSVYSTEGEDEVLCLGGYLRILWEDDRFFHDSNKTMRMDCC